MVEILKENWFVVLLAVILVGFVGFFVYDNNKYNVSGKSSEGSAVLASVAQQDITADGVYEDLSKNDDALLFNFYRNAVINEFIPTTDELKASAKNMMMNIEANAQSSGEGEAYKLAITAELGNYGYSKYEDLIDYCLTFAKEKEMDTKYIEKHFSDVQKAVEEKQARTISIITMSVADPEALTEEEQKKKDAIVKEIESESFADAAKKLSEDVQTAGNEGFYGYVDADTSSSELASEVLEASLSLNKGETSDWIIVKNENTGATTLYKVYVNETDLKKIYDKGLDSTKDAVLTAILQNNENLDLVILEDAANQIKDITYTNKETKKRIESYISTLKGENE
ncbi:MAG: peptidylprolyl isomerase [Bacillota bacterium]|nr:peptidylprolyl isomerase [Bacillota bacterium]